MRAELLGSLERHLEKLGDEDRRRSLELPAGLDFSSNDYLGLATDPRLEERFLRRLSDHEGEFSAPSSRLLRGHRPAHAGLERRLAKFKGEEAALLFPSGYQANLGLLSSLVGPGDRVLSDELNHASLIDGLRLARCRKVIVPHLDLGGFRRELETSWPTGRTYLVTESLFSMEGDIAPLDDYADLTDRYGAGLIVDDAHATGVFGEERGSGLTEHFGIEGRALAVISTFGKALGLAGAFVAGSRTLIEYLVNRARSFIFSTAPPVYHALAVEAALDLQAEDPQLRRRCLDRADRLRRRLREAGLRVVSAEGPIVPLILGSESRALAMAESLKAEGFDIRAVRPPTVPPGGSRVRISVHANHEDEQIDALALALTRTLAAVELAR